MRNLILTITSSFIIYITEYNSYPYNVVSCCSLFSSPLFAKEQLCVLFRYSPGALSVRAIIAIFTAQSFLHIAENAVGKGEFGQIDITRREHLVCSSLLTEICLCQLAGYPLVIGAYISVAEHARYWRLKPGGGFGLGGHGGHGQQRGHRACEY